MKIEEENILIVDSFADKNEAMNFIVGEFEKRNWVKPGYLSSLIARDYQESVAIGSYLALVHGQLSDKNLILKEGVLICKLKEKMLWDGKPILWILGLTLKENNQMDFLADIAIVFADENDSYNLWKKSINKKQIEKFFLNLN